MDRKLLSQSNNNSNHSSAAPTSYLKYEDLRDEEELGNARYSLSQTKTEYQKKLGEATYVTKSTTSSADGPMERFVDFFLVIILSGIFIFFCVIFYYDSLPVNKINSIVIINSFLPPSVCHQIIRVSELYAKEHSWTTQRHRNYPTTDIPVFYLNDYNFSFVDSQENNRAVPFVEWLNHTIERQIFPLMSDAFQIPIEETANIDNNNNRKKSDLYQFYIKDLFLVKYDATNPNSQQFLEKHIDSSLLTFVLSLSSPSVENNNEEKEKEDKEMDEEKLLSIDEKNSIDRIDGDHNSTSGNRAGGEDETDLKNIASHSYESGGTHFYLSHRKAVNAQGSLMLHNSRLYHEGVRISRGKRYLLVGFVNIRLISDLEKRKTDKNNEKNEGEEKEKNHKNDKNEGNLPDWQSLSISQKIHEIIHYYSNQLYSRKFGQFSHCIEYLTFLPREKEEEEETAVVHLDHEKLYDWKKEDLPVVRLNEYLLSGKKLFS
jgi:hypothetical protein